MLHSFHSQTSEVTKVSSIDTVLVLSCPAVCLWDDSAVFSQILKDKGKKELVSVISQLQREKAKLELQMNSLAEVSTNLM